MEEIQKLYKIVDPPVYLLRGTPYIIKGNYIRVDTDFIFNDN